MSKRDEMMKKMIEARPAMRAGRAKEAAETIRAILKPIEDSTAVHVRSNENIKTVELYNSTLRWPDTVGDKTVELTFQSSDERSTALPLIELIFSLDAESRTKLYKILSAS